MDETGNILVIVMKMSPVEISLILVGSLLVLSVILNYFQYRYLRNKYSGSRIHAALKEKELLKQLFDSAPDRIYFKDRESRFVLANKYVAAIMGEKDPAKLIGKTDFDFYDEKYAREYFNDEQTFMDLGKPLIAKEERGTNLDGDEIVVSTTKIPIRDNRNKVVGIIGIGRDISTQKKAEALLKEKSEHLKESNVLLEERQEEIQQMAEELNAQAENLRKVNKELERLSLVASKTENVVGITDGNGNFEWANEGFENRYGMKLEEFIEKKGKNLRENSSNDNIGAILNQIYISKKSYTYNSRYTDQNGKHFWSQSNITPILDSDNEIVNLILIDTDISEIKRAESKIKKQKSEIELQTVELRNINATKDRLFSIIAHDLKNPFHSILGFADILKKKYQTVEREKLNQYLGMIQETTSSAYQLLENLLEWARTQTKNVRYKPAMVSLSELVNEVVSLQSLHASNKKIDLINEVKEEHVAFIDRNMIQTVIRNLSSNAIKFTNEGGKVTFRAEAEKDHLKIHITDTGIGIQEEKIKTLFSLDHINSSSGTSGETGTGLGLVVCSEFMKINNGTIDVQSLPGKGSTFTLILPIKKV